MSETFPAFVKLEHKPDPGVDAAFLANVDSLIDRGRRKFATYGKEVSDIVAKAMSEDTLGRAMSLPRTAIDSLDLGVASLRHVAQQASVTAQAARELELGMERLQAETQDASDSMTRQIAAMRGLAAEKEEAAQAAMAQVRAIELLQDALDKEAITSGPAANAARAHEVANDNALGRTNAMRFGAMAILIAATCCYWL